MDISDTAKVLAVVSELWPQQSTSAETCRAWQLVLGNQEVSEVIAAVKEFASSKSSVFPPNVTEILDIARELKPKIEYKQIAPSSNDEVCLESYYIDREERNSKGQLETVRRHYVRASRGARKAIEAQYRRFGKKNS